MAPRTALAMVLLVLAASPEAFAQGRVAGDLPAVQLRFNGAAPDDPPRRVTVRVLTEARDCSARPTVTIVAGWRGPSSAATLIVSGIERVVRRSPRAARRTDQLRFRRVRAVRGRARLTATLVTDWRDADKGRRRCTLRLPRVVGAGDAASEAERGLSRLRTLLPVDPPRPVPQRVNASDHIWACGAGRRNSFDCGLRVTIGEPPPAVHEKKKKPKGQEPPPNGGGDDDEVPAWAVALLAALAAAGVAGAAASRDDKEATAMADSWDKLARDEFARQIKPVTAEAANLTKFGAPLATFLTAILAAFGGKELFDADEGETVIAVAVVTATAVGGLFYVLAADYRTRGAVWVERIAALARIMEAEREANEEERTKAADARKAMDECEAKAKKERDELHAREVAVGDREDAADARAAKAEQERDEAKAELEEAMAALQRCRERAATIPCDPAEPEPDPPPTTDLDPASTD